MLRKEPKPLPLLTRLARAETLSGSRIVLDATTPENELRCRASQISWNCVSTLERSGATEAQTETAVARLRAAYKAGSEFGDNRPEMFSFNGLQLWSGARFTYWQLLSFGMSGPPPPFEGFCERIGLAPEFGYPQLCAVVSLLDIDAAIAELAGGNAFGGATLIIYAGQGAAEMYSGLMRKRSEADSRARVQSHAGKRRHAKTDEFRKRLLTEWEAGKFQGVQENAVRWAIKEWSIDPETVRRWIRAHKRYR